MQLSSVNSQGMWGHSKFESDKSLHVTYHVFTNVADF